MSFGFTEKRKASRCNSNGNGLSDWFMCGKAAGSKRMTFKMVLIKNASSEFPFLISFKLIGFGNPFYIECLKGGAAFVCCAVLNTESIIQDEKCIGRELTAQAIRASITWKYPTCKFSCFMCKGDFFFFSLIWLNPGSVFPTMKCRNWMKMKSLISTTRWQLQASEKPNAAAYLLAVSGDICIIVIKSEY